MVKIEYDRFGRMMYNPEFHSKNGTPWSKEDIEYLIKYYDIAGPEEMSFALDRTSKTVMEKVFQLRKKDLMTKPVKQTWNKRIKSEPMSLDSPRA